MYGCVVSWARVASPRSTFFKLRNLPLIEVQSDALSNWIKPGYITSVGGVPSVITSSRPIFRQASHRPQNHHSLFSIQIKRVPMPFINSKSKRKSRNSSSSLTTLAWDSFSLARKMRLEVRSISSDFSSVDVFLARSVSSEFPGLNGSLASISWNWRTSLARRVDSSVVISFILLSYHNLNIMYSWL